MRETERKVDALEEALGAWRRVERRTEALNAPERVVQVAWSEGNARGFGEFRPTFAPRRWFVGLAAASVMAVAAVTVLTTHDPSSDSPVHLAAAKIDGEVVFTIANGNRTHSVKKATHPALLERAEAVRVQNGRYSDAAQDGAAIVFYRVD